MSKYERRRFFEDLCRLRAMYRLRSEYDTTSGLSIEDAIAYGSMSLMRPQGSTCPTSATTEASARAGHEKA
jgi:hypothetical protein